MTTCESCGRQEGHHLGCPEILRAHARNLVELDFIESLCASDGCPNPPKPWGGRGAKPRYCADHSKTK